MKEHVILYSLVVLILALQAQTQLTAQAAPVDVVEHASDGRTRKRSKREEEENKAAEIKQLLETQVLV